jgi:hypothetical protein
LTTQQAHDGVVIVIRRKTRAAERCRDISPAAASRRIRAGAQRELCVTQQWSKERPSLMNARRRSGD